MPEYKPRQADVIIHGIGDQVPMQTPRSFVETMTEGRTPVSSSKGKRRASRTTSRRRSMTAQNSIRAPSSMTRSGGTPKKSLAEPAFHDMNAKSRLRHRHIGAGPPGSQYARPR